MEEYKVLVDGNDVGVVNPQDTSWIKCSPKCLVEIKTPEGKTMYFKPTRDGIYTLAVGPQASKDKPSFIAQWTGGTQGDHETFRIGLDKIVRTTTKVVVTSEDHEYKNDPKAFKY